ncbi:porin family protein, partial [bacterium]|nr:porin family protein [bacterium]
HERYQQSSRNVKVAQKQVEPQAGNEGYEEIETVENNLAQNTDGADGETNQVDKFSGSNSASNTEGSPQINIYNANSNANKQKAVSESLSEGEAQVDTNVDSKVDSSGSYATDIKNTRKNLEYKTDEKVIEKLEWSRIEDEKDRADRLFGNRLDKKYEGDYKKEEEYQKPPVVVVEKPVAYEAPKTEVPYADKGEVKTYTSDSLFDQAAYIAPMVGTINTSASNMSADMAVGLAFGTRFATNFSVEGSFLYSDLTLDGNVNELIDGKQYASFKSGEQYSFGGGVSYHFTQWGILVPKISGLLAYTYREFNQTRDGNASGSSTAVDAGVGLGADLMVSKNFSIGAELRLMNNMSYSRDNSELDNSVRSSRYSNTNSRSRATGGVVSPLEEASYQMFLINGKFNF